MTEDDPGQQDYTTALFQCRACGKTAGVLLLVPGDRVLPARGGKTQSPQDGGGTLITRGFGGEGRSRVEVKDATALVEAIRVRDAREIQRLGGARLWAPFFCWRCGACYCQAHWKSVAHFDEGFFDYTEGTCPEGHRQKLDD